MKIFFDTSALVEIDRGNEEVIKLLDEFSQKNAELALSTISLSELYFGAFVQEKSEDILLKLKQVLSIFRWHSIDAKTAEELARIHAYKIKKGIPSEYQDSAIAASFIVSKADYFLTLNVKHFQIPSLKNKVFTPALFNKMLKEGKIKL